MRTASNLVLVAALAVGASFANLQCDAFALSNNSNNVVFPSPLSTSSSSITMVATSKNNAVSTTTNTASTTSRPPMDVEFQTARDAAVSALASQLPNPALEGPLVHFMDEYFHALYTASTSGSKNPDGSDITAEQATSNMMSTLGYGMKYGLGVGNPNGKFHFEDVRHRALRGPTVTKSEGEKGDLRYDSPEFRNMLGADIDVDFYNAGCDFFRPAIDLSRSLVLGRDHLATARSQLEAGENVIFLANHQSEADPQVVSCLFDHFLPNAELTSEIVYVAGHKVTTDALAVPFSMGRNLLCIHSKKHIDADPETKPAKSKQNMAAMNTMLAGLKAGGMAIWVAPSGGRDRRDVASGTIPIAPFDPKTVNMFRLMGNKSRVPTHFYPFSMVSYSLCPPPDSVEAGVGERRNVRYTPVGISIGEEVPNVGGADQRHLFTEHAERDCMEGYVRLLRGMGMESYIPK